MKEAIFLIEEGKALELVREHLVEQQRVRKQSQELARELGVQQVWTHKDNGVLVSVEFPDAVHPDFTKPREHGSKPKRGSEWARRFSAQVGYENPSQMIIKAFGIPHVISYGKGTGHGSRRIGVPFSECGFLYLGEDGPYAMWVPNIEAAVKADVAEGYTIEEPARSFRLKFDGCQRISQRKWNAIVREHELEAA